MIINNQSTNTADHILYDQDPTNWSMWPFEKYITVKSRRSINNATRSPIVAILYTGRYKCSDRRRRHKRPVHYDFSWEN